jgi:hypothetical protein
MHHLIGFTRSIAANVEKKRLEFNLHVCRTEIRQTHQENELRDTEKISTFVFELVLSLRPLIFRSRKFSGENRIQIRHFYSISVCQCGIAPICAHPLVLSAFARMAVPPALVTGRLQHGHPPAASLRV